MSKQKKEHKFTTYVDSETLDMINQLCEVFKMSPSAVCRQAIVRWWHSEPVLKSREAKKNGQPEETGT